MQKENDYRNLILGCCMTGIVMLLAFFFLYQTYIQNIIYEERLNQMEEVTHQMFQNLEEVIDSHWNRVREEGNYLREANVQTIDELCKYMKKKYELSAYEEQKITLIAVDSEGGYYTERGNRGLFRDFDYFEDNPKQISFVFDSMTDNQSEMVFLKRLSKPIQLQNGKKKTTIRYFGIAQNMEQLNPYFNCDAYDRNNSVYVLDDNGFKLFNSNKVELIKGHNVFSVLQKMKYLHNSSFAKTKTELEEKGCSYSNAVLDGTEYFYALKRMENAEWTLIFLVPAEYVATNTLELVNFIMLFIVIFTVIVAVCVILGISFVMRRNQQEAILVERENNIKLENVNTELRKANLAAEEAFQVAQEANRSKSSFLANMSHDIRTPMNAIIGITSLLRHDAGDKAKVIEYADKIDTSSQHLLGIINDVMDMSKIEAGKTIFSNLLSNAVKYTQEGGAIQFLVEECETNSFVYAKYRFLVSDNGMGMSSDFKDKIFDAFTRAENSLTNKIQGTGLGMAITRNLVEAMGGTIDVESEPGQGSCFEVLMDLKIAEERSVLLASQVEKEEPDVNVLKGMRFLCAEDNELNAEILMELLKIEDAECTICENGEKVLKTFEQSAPGDYDMILMDVQMPVMNGYEATKAIRRSSHELAKTIPIIAMTANAFSEDIQHSLAAGMTAHISKPVEMKALKKTIRNIKSGGGGRKHTCMIEKYGK